MIKKYIFWSVFVGFLIAHACLVLNIEFFPFADVPNHLAEGTIYNYYNDASTLFSKYYDLNYFLYPNTFHLFFFSLPIFPDVEVANRIMHLLVVVSLPVLVLLIVLEIKGNAWFAIMSFVLVYGFNLTFGFTNNAIANNVVLLILWLWLRSIHSKKNNAWFMLTISALMLLVYFLHAMMALFCLLFMFCFIVYRYRSNLGLMVLNLTSLAPLGLLIVYWWVFIQHSTESSAGYSSAEVSTLASMKEYYSSEFLQTYKWRLMFLFADNYQLFAGNAGYVIGIVMSSVIIIPFLVIIYKYVFQKYQINTLVYSFVKDQKLVYIILFLGVSATCFFLLPKRIPGQEPLYERFCTILLFALLFLGSKIPEVNTKAIASFASLIAVVHLVLWAQYFYQFNQENKDFAEILPQERGKVLSYINYDPFYRGRLPYDQFQNYFIVRKKGIATSKIIDYRFGMIRKKEINGLPRQGDVYRGESPRKLMQVADYILVRGTISPEAKHILDSLNTFSKVKDINKWHLLKRK